MDELLIKVLIAVMIICLIGFVIIIVISIDLDKDMYCVECDCKMEEDGHIQIVGKGSNYVLDGYTCPKCGKKVEYR
jgi:hypothetical protein